jgi:hypothetical protein
VSGVAPGIDIEGRCVLHQRNYFGFDLDKLTNPAIHTNINGGDHPGSSISQWGNREK